MRTFNDNNGCASLLSRTGKKLLTTTAMTAVGLLSLSGQANAADDWTGHTVIGGGGSISYDAAPPANTTNITQTGQRVKVNGDGDIKAGWTVNLNQDSSSAQYILFDTEADPTNIMGSLNANGQVFIFDQNGVIFSPGSQVNVGSIVASSGTLTSDDAELDTGKVSIALNSATDGAVTNGGIITVAEAGLAAFVAPNITNSNYVNAKMGTIAMAAGQTVTLDMYGDGLVEVAVNGALADGLISNTGTIEAQGGNVIISAEAAKNAVDNVINMGGTTTVTGFTSKAGKIVLSGGSKGTVNLGDFSSTSANGSAGYDAGSVEIKGENIVVGESLGPSQPTVSADGFNQSLSANAAGDVSLIATNALTINGRVSAQGLAGTGFVETSAPTTTFGPLASVLATREWFLDPTNFTIDNPFAALVNAQLNFGDMTIQTNGAGGAAGNITLLNGVAINKTAGADSTFTLNAHNDITIAGTIGATGAGALNVNLNADFDVGGSVDADIFILNDINTNGGTFTAIASDDIDIKNGATVSTGGGKATITSRGRGPESWLWMPAAGNSGTLTTSGGDIDITVGNIFLSNGSSINAVTGAVSIERDVVGTIGLGSGAGDMQLGQAELDRITASSLSIGGNNTTDINVAGADMDAFSTVNLSALAASGINFFGVNNFATLNATTDIITLLSGSSVNALNSIFFDAPLVNLDGNLNAPSISGTATTVNVNNNGNLPVVNEEIQDGIDVAAAGATVNVGDGTYIENLLIGKSINLLSVNGRSSTTIEGISGVGRLGTVQFAPNTTGVQLGDTNQGFTIVGIDNGFPGIENAALYLQGNQSNHIIRGNDIVANGDSGLTSEFGATVSDIIIDDNIFSGQTFTGTNPAGVGFGSQFTTPNVPRQLVVMGGGTGGGNTSNITFTNNQITGTAGGISTDDNVSPQGNTLVTIDSKGAIITGNTFHGETTRFGSSLRSRGTNTLISGNTFYADGLTDTNAHLFVHSGIYDGANVDGIQDDIMDIWNSNTFIGRATVTDNDIDPNFDGIGLTIQGAINASNSGANVFVNGATYTENLLIDRALKLTGLPGATLQAAGAGSLITVTAANVNIDPFAFDGLGIASYGINANGAHNLVVDGNSFANFLDTNINVTNSNAVRIKNNTMTGAQKGVFGDNTKDMHVFDNDISGTTVAGIHIKNSDGVGYNGGQNDIDIWSNTVASAAGTGIWVQNSKFASIGDHPTNPFETGYGGANIVTGGSAGIVVENSDKAWISHNIVDDINGDGIAIHGGADVTVLKNKVGTNGAADNIKGDGIFAQNANNILISMNTVDETHSTSNAKGSGIQVLGSNNANINQNTITNAGWDSVRVVGGNNVSIHKNTGTNSKRAGIYAEGLTNSSVTENTIDGTAQFRGISVQGGNNILVGKNKVDNTKLDGIIANNVQNLTVDGNLVGKNAGNIGAHGISIDAANNTTTNVTNNQVANTA
ncbi:MAG TPA: right-handed parallel beta-helix repeat-containing protein, partial [Alphaproteobacteria bacterium]|nr:right-handed parallel beta-helix repeat-containing protein [Alphaproteobacteria bacterium]